MFKIRSKPEWEETKIGLAEALAIILSHTPAPTYESIPLEDSLNRVLAKPVSAQMSMPPFDRSPLDGYAFRAEDTEKADQAHPVRLRLVKTITAGCREHFILEPGTCVRIMTGAPIPVGADAVIPQEKAEQENGFVLIPYAFTAETNIVRTGEDFYKNEVLIHSGVVLEAVHLGILSSLGLKDIPVYKNPKIAIFATGSELVPPGEPLTHGQIYDSNSAMVSALAQKCYAKTLKLGIAKDHVEAIASFLLRALKKADVVITTGGVSVGECDLLDAALKTIGANILFGRVKIKPGSPMIMAVKDHKPIFCLSGNPAAAYVTFEQFVRSSLYKMVGRTDFQRLKVQATLEHSLSVVCKQDRLMRAICSYSESGFTVKVAGNDRPGVLSSLVNANSLIMLPAGSKFLNKGDFVNVELLDMPRYNQSPFKIPVKTERGFMDVNCR